MVGPDGTKSKSCSNRRDKHRRPSPRPEQANAPDAAPTVPNWDTRSEHESLRLEARSVTIVFGSWVGCITGKAQMMYRSLALAIAALSSTQIATAEAQSVYVAPGGIYVQSARLFVNPAPYGSPAPLVPGPAYGPPAVFVPGPAYGAPAYGAPAYGAPAYIQPAPAYGAPAYGEPPDYVEPELAYVARERMYLAPTAYAKEIAPRPPASVPNARRHRSSSR